MDESSSDIAHYFGRVHPERASLDVLGLPPIRIGYSADSLATINLQIGVSQISVVLTGQLHTEAATQRNAITSITQAIVDALGFVNSCGYRVEITGVARSGKLQVFGVDLAVESLPDNGSEGLDFLGIAGLLLDDPTGRRWQIGRALADYRRAILEPDDTAFHCYRAVEVLIYHFADDRSEGWAALREALNVDKSWIVENLKEPADLIRHGRLVQISSIERTEVLNAARRVISRFCLLQSRQIDKLPLDEFPLLSLG